MYPSLPYIERIALKDSVIPLRTPIITPSGHSLSQIRVSAGQVRTYLSSSLLPLIFHFPAPDNNNPPNLLSRPNFHMGFRCERMEPRTMASSE
jgi:hypothetical protein